MIYLIFFRHSVATRVRYISYFVWKTKKKRRRRRRGGWKEAQTRKCASVDEEVSKTAPSEAAQLRNALGEIG